MQTIALRRSLLLALGLSSCATPSGEDGGDGETSGETTSATKGTSTSTASSSTTQSQSTSAGTTGTATSTTTSGESGDSTVAAATSDPGTGTGSSESGTTAVDTSGVDASTTGEDGCEPIVEVQSGEPSGFETCEGVVVRRDPVSCSPIDPSSIEVNPTCSVPEYSSCGAHEDCQDEPSGLCLGSNGGEAFCYCAYPCATDADCDDGTLCLCGIDVDNVPLVPHCIPTDCDSDADCEEGFSCALAVGNDGCGWNQRMACHTAQDTCTTNADCGDTSFSGGCYPNDAGIWECIEPNCVIGRPFVVAGEVTVASSTARADWVARGSQGPTAPAPGLLDEDDRRALHRYWLRNATLEHASVASFARFVLQLMHLGAPPTLLRASTQAMQDEIDHAERCFALAGRYGGEVLGPDRLPLGVETLQATSRLEILEAVIVEACIGETLAALEAAVALEHATDGEVRDTLSVIARDEARHAALGWETLRWALASSDAPTRVILESMVHAAIAEARARAGQGETTHHSETLTAHGMLSGPQRSRVIREGLDEVIAPVAASLAQDVEAHAFVA